MVSLLNHTRVHWVAIRDVQKTSPAYHHLPQRFKGLQGMITHHELEDAGVFCVDDCMIVSDEPTNLQTFAQYRLRFCVEKSFLDLKSNGFNLKASRLRDKFALSQLCGVIALTVLFLVLQGVQVVASGQRRQVDAH